MTVSSKSPVTIRDIAAEAGVSVSTVSYSLKNDRRISPQTREHVQAVARKLGYRANPIYSAMMRIARRGSRVAAFENVIAYLVGFESKERWHAVSSQAQMLAGATERATRNGFRLEPLFYRAENWSDARLEQILLSRGIRGLIVAPFMEPNRRLNLDWSQFASVAIGYTLETPMLNCVTADHYYDLYLALEKAYANGARRIGCVLEHAISERIEGHWNAVFQTMARKRADAVSVPPIYIRHQNGDKQRLWDWQQEHQPDHLIYRRQICFEFVRKALPKIELPPGSLLFRDADGVGMAGIDENSGLIGCVAVDTVLNQLQNNDFGVPASPILIQVRGAWVPVGSLCLHSN